LVEQRIENPRVGCSIQPQATKFQSQPFSVGFVVSGLTRAARGSGPVMRVPHKAGPRRQDGFFSPSFDSSLFSVLQVIPRTLQIWNMQNPPPANKRFNCVKRNREISTTGTVSLSYAG
jgi:hypothetical protein